MSILNSKKPGFTIVELIVVIVVIAILAAIAIVSYNFVQRDANDARRLQDVSTIEKAMKLYIAKNSKFPMSVSGVGFWDVSYVLKSDFLKFLVDSKVLDKVPVDPVNSSTLYYRYYRYNAGAYGCDVSRGGYAVFIVHNMETSGRPHPQSPGFQCPERDWKDEGDYVFGIFENG